MSYEHIQIPASGDKITIENDKLVVTDNPILGYIEGDGIDDHTSTPYGHGFGWVDMDHDGLNDVFHDSDGDGVNDLTGHSYTSGFGHMGDGGMHPHDPMPWPVEPEVGPGGGGVMGPNDPMHGGMM